ncbi:MAG: hypothetical protein HYW52_03640 [Gemmatimonadetes bacterium]|nr:hypothetical protein [Gemmatimonadota bacterium]
MTRETGTPLRAVESSTPWMIESNGRRLDSSRSAPRTSRAWPLMAAVTFFRKELMATSAATPSVIELI